MTAIATSPKTSSIPVGSTEQFTAMATYSDGSTANVTATANWTDASAKIATITPSGDATAVASGSTTVTATVNAISGSATLTVAAATNNVTSIAVSPATAAVAAGATQQFTATATYSDGSTQDVTAMASWAAANPAVAAVNSAGLATAVGPGSTAVTASLTGINGTATLTVTSGVTPTLSSISVLPNPAAFAMGSTQQFTATAHYGDGSTADVTASAKWAVANDAVATVSTGGLATGVASGSSTITATISATTGAAPLTVTIPSAARTNVVTWHFDANRSGLNPNETSLSPANLSPSTFGKLFSYLVDGYAYSEPLLMSNVTINGSMHNVLYVATEHDSVYAFDADSYGSGAPLWQVSLLQPGETPIPGPIQPYEGVTGTPVIDPVSGTIYVVSVQKPANTAATFRLSALDIATGMPKFGGPVAVQASVPATNSDSVNGMESLPTACIQRAALLLANGSLYIGFGGCHSGWLLAYDAHTLAQTGVFNVSPNLNGEGLYASAGGVWMGGGGPAADSAGNVYITTGNGPWDGLTAWSDSVLKFNSTLQLQDYFTPVDYQYMDCQDADLAAGGLLLIPGTSQALAGGKTGKLYLVNTANLGKEQPNDAGATQTLFFESDLISPYSSTCTDSLGAHTATVNSYEIFGTAAYFNGSVYLGITPTSVSAPAGVRQFTYSSGQLTPGAYTNPGVQRNTRGTTPFISANGTNSGILWMIDTGQPLQSPGTSTSATLRAYDANHLGGNELYDSGDNPADVAGFGIKFTSPIVANGKVYISTGHDAVTASSPRGEIDVYGLK